MTAVMIVNVSTRQWAKLAGRSNVQYKLLGENYASAVVKQNHQRCLSTTCTYGVVDLHQSNQRTNSSQKQARARAYSSTAKNLYTLDFSGSGGGGPSFLGGGGGSGGGGGGGFFSSVGGRDALDIARWPVQKRNTILNVVPQGQRFVVERLGKLRKIEDSGYFFAIPFIDAISYVIDVRERAIDIKPQAAITKDNVSVQVSGVIYVQFVDPERAAYGARNPLYAVMQHAQSAMRSAIGEMELDEILHGRARLNTLIKGSVQEAAVAWGLEIRRYEITEITPDEEIRNAMDKQAAAERARRERVLQAEGDKQRAQLTSEGVKISLTNESEGNLIKVRNEAEALKQRLVREGEGEAEATRIKAGAQAEAISIIAAELNKPGGLEAAKIAVARDYITMFGEMGSKSNTMLFNDKPADVNALLAQAALAIKAVPSSNNDMATPPNEVTQAKDSPDSVDVVESTFKSDAEGMVLPAKK